MISGFMDSFRDDPDLFITTFGEYVVGAQPGDWTSRYGTGFTAQVQAVVGSLSGKALRWTKTGAARQGLSWDKVPLTKNVEILIRARAIEAPASNENFIGVYGRGGGALGTETGYRFMVAQSTSGPNWNGNIGSYVAGSATFLGTITNGPSPTYAVNAWFWARFGLLGTTLRRKQWYSGSAEPGAWDESLTNSDVTTAGWSGLQQASANPNTEIDFFGVALNGKSMPLLIP